MDLNLLLAVAQVFRHLHPAMKEMEQPQVAEWGEANKPRVLEFLEIMDRALQDQLYITGDHFTVADITGAVSVDFLKPAKLTIPEHLVNLRRWHAQVSERPSMRA